MSLDWCQSALTTVPLGRVVDVQLGKMLQPEKRSGREQAVPYLRAGLISGSADDLPRMFASKDEILRYGVRQGDVLVAEGGDVGRAEFAPPVDDDTILQNSLHRLRGDRDVLRFVRYCLEAVRGSAWLDVLTNRATFGHLTREKLTALRIPWSGPAERRAIADFLDGETARIDGLIDKRQTMVGLLNERRAVVMYDGVRGIFTSTRALVESSVPWLDRRPDGWRDVKVKMVAQLGSGHTPSRDRPEWWTNGTIPWVTTGEVVRMRSDRLEFIQNTREKISELGLANSAAVIHPAGTVVLCRTAASAGYSAIMATDMATSQDFATWTCEPLLRPRFLLLCLRAMRSDLLGRLAMGSTHKTIYMPDLEAIRIPLPPVGEQDEILEEVQRRLQSIDVVIQTLTRQIALLKERRQALITAAVTGELDVSKGAA